MKIGNKLKNYIITGGAGFIGSNLCRKILLEEEDVRIICIDDFCSSNKKNIEDLLINDRFTLSIQDISKDIFLTVDSVDKIYHLACMASPKYYQNKPIKTLDTCYIGTKNVLDLAKKYNARILFTSTSEVYGDPLIKIQKEDYYGNVNPIGIRACYDEGKRVAEALCMEYKRQFNTNVCIIRIFNTYGPYMSPNDGRVIPNFITQCINNNDITIYGNGSQTRSFCYITDQLNGIQKMIKSKETGPINIGNPQEFTILELAHKIKLLTHSNSNIIYKDLPENDPKIRKPDIVKAMILLKWYPQINLDDGLKKTIDFFIK